MNQERCSPLASDTWNRICLRFSLCTYPAHWAYWGGNSGPTSQCKWWSFSRTPRGRIDILAYFVLTPWNSMACSLTELQSSDIIRPWISIWGSRSASGSLQSSPSGLCIHVAKKMKGMDESKHVQEPKKEPKKKPKNVISCNFLQCSTVLRLLHKKLIQRSHSFKCFCNCFSCSSATVARTRSSDLQAIQAKQQSLTWFLCQLVLKQSH